MAEAKVALVTGSSSGIGEATVKLLASKGYKLTIVGSKQTNVERVAQECVELSPEKFQPLALVLDFSNPQNGQVAVEKTVEHFGRLDVLINNAGIYVKTRQMADYDLYRHVMSINLDSSVKATLAAQEHLIKAKGNLIFVSSVASFIPSPYSFAYNLSKASLTMFGKNMAVDLAPHVRVNIVSPGPVKTPIFERIGFSPELAQELMSHSTLQQRIGESEEVAKTIAFLISDEATYIHGHELVIDGGYALKPASNSVQPLVSQHLASQNKPSQ